MKDNFTSINVIIDKSGSMASLQKDTIGGFNQFLTDQKALDGEATLTLCTFNSTYNLVHDFLPLDSIPNLDVKSYSPSGGTALLDAMGTTINSIGSKLSAMKEEDRPSKVLFLVITDGEENSSREFSKAKIKEMVEHQTNVYNWTFVFMAANMDSFTEGTSMGFAGNNTMSYSANSVGTKNLYKNISDSTRSYRSSGTYVNNDIDLTTPITPTNILPVTPTPVTVDVTPVKATTRRSTRLTKMTK